MHRATAPAVNKTAFARVVDRPIAHVRATTLAHERTGTRLFAFERRNGDLKEDPEEIHFPFSLIHF